MPASMSDQMKDLLTGLLRKDPGSRLGCRGRGSEELKEMAYFRTTNWDDVMAKKVCLFVSERRGRGQGVWEQRHL